MTKKYITPVNIAFFLWGLLLLTVSILYPEYTRYYLYLSIAVIIPIAVVNLIKMKREDRLNDTINFRLAIYRMLIMALFLVIFFFITKQNLI